MNLWSCVKFCLLIGALYCAYRLGFEAGAG